MKVFEQSDQLRLLATPRKQTSARRNADLPTVCGVEPYTTVEETPLHISVVVGWDVDLERSGTEKALQL